MNGQNYGLKGWKFTGDSILTGQFIGTTNAQDLILKANNTLGLRILSVNSNVVLPSLSGTSLRPVFADTIGTLIPHINQVQYTQGAPKPSYSNTAPYVIHGDNSNIGSGGLTISNTIQAGDLIILSSKGIYNSTAGATVTGSFQFANQIIASTPAMTPPVTRGGPFNGLYELDIRLTFFDNGGLNVSCIGSIKFIDPGTSNLPVTYILFNNGLPITLTNLLPQFFVSWSVSSPTVGTTSLSTDVQHLRY